MSGQRGWNGWEVGLGNTLKKEGGRVNLTGGL